MAHNRPLPLFLVIGVSLAAFSPPRPLSAQESRRDRVPALAPDSVPLAIWDSLHAISNMTPGGPCMTGPYPVNLLLLHFRSGVAQPTRQVIVDSVKGEVVGGVRIGPDGYYYIRLPWSHSGADLCAAAARLGALPEIRSATPELAEIGPAHSRAAPSGQRTGA